MNAATMLMLTLLLLLTACSREPQWVSIPNGKFGELIDLSSIAASGNVRTASIRVILATRASWDTAPEATRVTEVLARQAYNCTENSQKNEALTFHYANGMVSEIPPGQLPAHDWKVVEREDGMPELDFVCAHSRK
jgi:hypothetical protein